MKRRLTARNLVPRGVFAKLVTVFLVIGLVPFLGVEVWTYNTARERMTETVIGSWLVRLARETAAHLDSEVARMRDLVYGWAEDEVFARDIPLCAAGGPEGARARTRLEGYLRNRHRTRQDQIDYLFVIDADGRILADSLPATNGGGWRTPLTGLQAARLIQDPAQRDWLRNALTPRPRGGASEDTAPTLASLDWHRSQLLYRARHGVDANLDSVGPSLRPGDYALGFAGSVRRGGEASPAGAVGVVFNWRRVQGILDKVQERFREGDDGSGGEARYDTGYGFLFANDRDTIIAHKLLEGTTTDERALLHGSLTRDHGLDVFTKRMARTNWGYLSYDYPPGTPKISGFARTRDGFEGGFGWYVGVGINDQQIYADVYRLEQMLMISALIVTGLVILGAAVFSHRITDPITRLIRYTAEVARGNLDARVNVGTRDEIAVLADSFNRMVGELKESNRRLVDAEKNAAWQEMARQVAHEIKNPLTPIKLSAQQISRAHQDGHPAFRDILSESVQSIIEQCEHLGQIASDFAAFAAFEVRKPEETDLCRLLEGVAGPYVEASSRSRLITRLDLRLPEGTSAKVDRGELRRVFLNLINNAHEAMSPAGGTLTISAAPREHEGRKVAAIAFSDTGCGIRPEDRAHLFEPYFSTRTGGTGLGLALCKKIVQGHGGSIEVESAVGQGTTMTLLLPLDPDGGEGPGEESG